MSRTSINAANAGSTIPVKFTLVGGAPAGIDSQAVDCSTLVPTGEAPTALATPGNTGLTQQGTSFHINWQTDSNWAGSCRRVTVRIPAATDAVAFFQFP